MFSDDCVLYLFLYVLFKWPSELCFRFEVRNLCRGRTSYTVLDIMKAVA